MTAKRTGNITPSKIPAKWCITPNQATIYNVRSPKHRTPGEKVQDNKKKIKKIKDCIFLPFKKAQKIDNKGCVLGSIIYKKKGTQRNKAAGML